MNFLEKKLIPVAVVPEASQAEPLGAALLEAGLNVIEVTLRTPSAIEVMTLMKKRFPEMQIGAGTVIDPEIVPQLVDIGVTFAVSPGLNPRVVEACQKANLPITPGIITPGEFEAARALGCNVLKFFPAEAAGGAA